MSYEGYIFDLDGVICHTDNYHYLAWKKLADKLDIDFNEERNNLLRGVSRMESLDLVLNEKKNQYSDEEKALFALEKNKSYVELLNNMTEDDLPSDVKNTLLNLKQQGKKLAIGSSSKNARIILNKLNITNLFDVIVDGNDITYSKPNPEVFLKASSKLGIDVSKCVVIEDALSGVEAGLSGGFDVFAIGDATKDNRVKRKLKILSDIL